MVFLTYALHEFERPSVFADTNTVGTSISIGISIQKLKKVPRYVSEDSNQ